MGKNQLWRLFYANAVEFSTMQAQRLGVGEKYGDTQYPPMCYAIIRMDGRSQAAAIKPL